MLLVCMSLCGSIVESAIRLAFIVLRIACVFAILCLAFGVAVSSCGLGSKVVVA